MIIFLIFLFISLIELLNSFTNTNINTNTSPIYTFIQNIISISIQMESVHITSLKNIKLIIINEQTPENAVYKKIPGNSKIIIECYHFLIGSKMMSPELTTYNHEYPSIVKLINTDIYSQFANKLQLNLLENNILADDIIVVQYIFLIDPMYKHYPEIEGFKTQYPISINVETQVKTINNIFVIADNINQEFLEDIISLIDFDVYVDITQQHGQISKLVNIMDFSSNTVRDLYINNRNPNVYISPPDCQVIDTDIFCNPIMTLSEFKIPKAQYPHTHLPKIRWININYDIEYYNKMEIMDKAKLFLDVLKIQYMIEIELYGLSRLWSFLQYQHLVDKDITCLMPCNMFMNQLINMNTLSNNFIYRIDIFYQPYVNHFINKIKHEFINHIVPDKYLKNDFTIEDYIKNEIRDKLNYIISVLFNINLNNSDNMDVLQKHLIYLQKKYNPNQDIEKLLEINFNKLARINIIEYLNICRVY